jgi:branched-subunit amino acid transport protein AzlD
MAFIILFTRLLPFLFFRKKRAPDILNYLERNVPPLVMLVLVLYCLKDVKWDITPYGVPELIGIGTVVFFHVWFKNALISIVCGTALYMLLIRVI